MPLPSRGGLYLVYSTQRAMSALALESGGKGQGNATLGGRIDVTVPPRIRPICVFIVLFTPYTTR